MLNVKLVCVGKLKESWLSSASAEYIKRLSRYCSFSLTELSECTLPESPSQSQIDAALEKEGAEIEKACAGCYTVAACIEGRKVTSEGLSELLEKVSLSGKGKMAFVIGSSHGLSESVKRKADFRLSVSDMTFPHQLFRVMLLEQIYRAFTISAGAKSHK